MSHEILINVDRTVTVVNGVLDAVVGRLQLYWYRRYVIHKALIRCQLRSQEMFGQLCNACQSVISNDNFLFHIEEHARQCHCCAISRLVPYVRIMEEARENQTSSGKDGTTQTMTVMGSFECKIHLPRALVDEAPSTVYKSEVRVISAALISDQFAGSPFATYLQQRSKTLTVNCLIFWQRALALLQSCIISQLLNPLVFGNESNILVLSVGSQSETSFEERTQSLLDMFIKNEAECDFGLSASLRHQLCHLLPLGYGKQYLVEAQEYAFKILKRQWSKYAARDQDCFWASVKSSSVGLPHKLSKPQIARFRKPKSPLTGSPQSNAASVPISNNRAWHALNLVLPTHEKGLCEVHSLAGVTSCGSVTSLGPRRGPILLNKHQLANTRFKLEEERLKQLKEDRVEKLTKVILTNEVSTLETPPKRKSKPSYLTKPKCVCVCVCVCYFYKK
jgi:hypothetical protein